MAYEKLLSPVNIGSLTIKNRTMMTAAEMNMGQINGCPTERLMSYYEERAKGGVGLIIPGICRVNDGYATSSFGQLAMSHDYHIEPMREFAERIHKHRAKLGIQLHHPGRQGYCSVVNTLPMLLPVVKKFPGVLKPMYKSTPKLMALEERGICQPVAAPSVVERSYHVPSPIRAMNKRLGLPTGFDFIKPEDYETIAKWALAETNVNYPRPSALRPHTALARAQPHCAGSVSTCC